MKLKPIGIRHHYSGVWVGYLCVPEEGDPPEDLPLMPHMIKIVGRRIWSWSGERLEFSELCAKGTREADKLGVWTEQQIPIGPGDGLVELTFQIADEIVQGYKAHGQSDAT